MVYLDRIYTKSGDRGETSLGDGTRVPKTHPRLAAYGTVDEVNSAIGVAVACGSCTDAVAQQLRAIQNDLFDLGADLCVPITPEPLEYVPLRIQPAQVTQLEIWIDSYTSQLTPLNSFILPGGTPAAAFLHLARTICRRAEIAVQMLAERETINEQSLIYLNRLSDLLFVLARYCNHQGTEDILWAPGQSQSTESPPTEPSSPA